ncbi:MAG: hypothetical protein NWF03_03050 [Candidatus Bathyarchaeota archaeon]|nr:hypothetical protein [Candidatus Bathyarchaeota archaeon]
MGITKRVTLIISVILFLNLLSIFVPQAIVGKTVNASNASYIYAPNLEITNPPIDADGEIELTSAVAEYIRSVFANYRGYYDEIRKDVDQDAIAGRYTSNAFAVQQMHDYATVFSKGHAADGYFGHPVKHHYLRDHYDNPMIDNSLLPYTGGGEHHFVVIWHCDTATPYPGEYCSTCGSYTGLPYSYTRTNTMSTNGYTSPDSSGYAFVGFQGYSPQFLDPTGYGNNNYANFVSYLYYCLIQYDMSLNSALREASLYTLGTYDFASTWLYQLKIGYNPFNLMPRDTRIRILGDGYLEVA